jgi:hypothetical protein
MSALGQKRTYAARQVMSALPPKADMCSATAYVCFGPIADIDAYLSKSASPSKTNTGEMDAIADQWLDNARFRLAVYPTPCVRLGARIG